MRERLPDLIISCDFVHSVAHIAVSGGYDEFNIYMQSSAYDITRFDSDLGLGEPSFLDAAA